MLSDLRVGMKVVCNKRTITLIRYIEKWHGEHVWFVEEMDGHQHIEVFERDLYIAMVKEAA